MRVEVDMEATKNMKTYTVGDMARMLSMNPPTIRFYDQEKIVVPSRNDENQYRQYTVVDGNYLLKTKELKNAGLSVQETQKMLNEYGLDQFQEGLLAANQQLEQEIFRLSLYRLGVKKYYQRCQKCISDSRISLEKRPEMYRYTHQINDVFLEGPGRIETLKVWTDYLPLTVLSFLFRKEELLENIEEADLYWGFSVEANHVEGTGLDCCELSDHWRECNCVHFIFSTKNEVFLKARYLRPALSYIREHHFTLCGDVVGNSLARVINEDGVVEHYYEAWLPIQ